MKKHNIVPEVLLACGLAVASFVVVKNASISIISGILATPTSAISAVGSVPGIGAGNMAINYKYVAGEVLVKFKEGSTPGEPSKYKAKSYEKISGSRDLYLFTLENPSADIISYIKSLTKDDKTIEYGQPNFKYKVSSHSYVENPNLNPLFRDGWLWGLYNTGSISPFNGTNQGISGADIEIKRAWEFLGSTSVANSVCLIDTGVKANHEDLVSVVIDSKTYIPGGDPLTDSHGHGTHLAGIIAAHDNDKGVIGVNPKAKIISIQSFNGMGEGATDRVIQGISWGLSRGCKIVNLGFEQVVEPASIASEIIEDKALFDVVSSAVSSTMFVVSAGNGVSGPGIGQVGIDLDVTKIYPGSLSILDNVVTVTATDRIDTKTVWANFGKASVQVGAPGQNIISTDIYNAPFLPAGYFERPGTSQATAYVSGTISLLSDIGSISPKSIKDRLVRTVDIVPGLVGVVTSGGRVNASKFLFDNIQQPLNHYRLP